MEHFIAYGIDDLKKALASDPWIFMPDDTVIYTATERVPSSGEIETIYTALAAVRPGDVPFKTAGEIRG